MLYTNEQMLDLFEGYLSQAETPAEPELLYSPIVYSMSGGGKRLRPLLLLLTAQAFGGDAAAVMPAAVAVEVFHNFTLLHDDIMDNADMRRGKPSVYKRWGANVAILSGDAMMICAYKTLSKINPDKLPRVVDMFSSMALQVCEGQQYDMDFEKKRKVSVVDYIQMIESKTSALLSGAATIGAVLADAGEEDVRRIHRFATELGLAFQLQDDLLDSYGDVMLGKKIGGDILEGKQTYLMVQAMSLASEPQREILRTTHSDASLTDAEKIERVRAVYDSLGVARMTEQQISLRFERALGVLDTLSIGADRREPLAEFARNLMGRKR